MMKQVYWYGWWIEYIPKPIEMRGFDYEFSHEDYDGAPDADDIRRGCGVSVEHCIEQIREIEDELEA